MKLFAPPLQSSVAGKAFRTVSAPVAMLYWQVHAADVVVDVRIDRIELDEAARRRWDVRAHHGSRRGVQHRPAAAPGAVVETRAVGVPPAVRAVDVAITLRREIVREAANRRAEDGIDVRLSGQGKAGLTRHPRSRRGIRKRPGRRRRMRHAVGEALGSDARGDEGVGDDRQHH